MDKTVYIVCADTTAVFFVLEANFKMKLLPRPFLNPPVPVTCAVQATPALLKTINFDSLKLCNLGGRHSRTVHGDPDGGFDGREGGAIKRKEKKKISLSVLNSCSGWLIACVAV